MTTPDQDNQPQHPPAKPFVSRAQMEHFRKMVDGHQIPQAMYDAKLAVTDVDNLPERVVTAKASKKKEACRPAPKPSTAFGAGSDFGAYGSRGYRSRHREWDEPAEGEG